MRFRSLLLMVVLLAAMVPDRTQSAQKPAVICTYDARPLNKLDLHLQENAVRLWDTMHALAALQGLANRSEPSLYIYYCSEFGVDTDKFWFDWLRGEDGWLAGAELRPLRDFEDVVKAFRSSFKGLVVWDPAVPATSNLASTAAGCEDLLPVRFDPKPGSVYDMLKRRLNIPVKLWMLKEDGSSLFTGAGQIPDSDEPSSGSAKIDSYKWALKRFVRPGGCTPGVVAYYVDAFWVQQPRRAGPTMHTLSNHDYFIARRAFFFDLSCWGDEAPNDDLQQPLGADRKMFLDVMRAIYTHSHGSVVQVGGFTPWPFKYTVHAMPKGKYEGVPTEWEFARLISQFNGYMEADAAGLAAMANASLFAHYPLKEKYTQPNKKPGIAEWRSRGFIKDDNKVVPKLFLGHYVGDYDAPSWLYKAVPAFFPNPVRGKVPLAWAFNPNLADRAPIALAYAYRHATTNDFFISGDSGAGYINPRALTARPDAQLPSGLKVWSEHCRRYFQRWDMTITGFLLDGASGSSTELEFAAYRPFSADGIGTHFEKGPVMKAGIPTCPERDLPDDTSKAAEVVLEAARAQTGSPAFFWARSILRNPEWYSELSRKLDEGGPGLVEVVDPYTFFGLIAHHLKK